MKRIVLFPFWLSLLLAFGLGQQSCKKGSAPAPQPSRPTVNQVSPTSGRGGTIMTIAGTNLQGTDLKVTINGKSAVIRQATATRIQAEVPTNCGSGPIELTVAGQTIRNQTDFVYLFDRFSEMVYYIQTMATPTPRMAAVINPLALAELILGEPIEVNKPEELKPVLEKVLQAPFHELFDPKYRSLPYLLVNLDEKGRGIPRQFPKDLATQPVKMIDEFLLTLKYQGYDKLPFRTREKLIWILIKGFPDAINRVDVEGITWRDLGDFYEEGTEFADPVQGALGDCYLIAALTAIAWARPYAILQRNRATGPDNQSFVNAIDIMEVGSGTVSRIEVNEKVPCNVPANAFIYGRSSESTEMWPALYEKAYGRWRNRGSTSTIPTIRD